MAAVPHTLTQLIEQYGPHLHDTPPGGWQRREPPDRLVKTHCCFCGVQCGIQPYNVCAVRLEKVAS